MKIKAKPEWLDLEFLSDDLDKKVTIRKYLSELLLTVWREGEGFSGKRPFGNSGWQRDLAVPLIHAGAVTGKTVTDEDGYVEIEGLDRVEYEGVVADLIKLMGKDGK